jgi:hypothetical protein
LQISQEDIFHWFFIFIIYVLQDFSFYHHYEALNQWESGEVGKIRMKMEEWKLYSASMLSVEEGRGMRVNKSWNFQNSFSNIHRIHSPCLPALMPVHFHNWIGPYSLRFYSKKSTISHCSQLIENDEFSGDLMRGWIELFGVGENNSHKKSVINICIFTKICIFYSLCYRPTFSVIFREWFLRAVFEARKWMKFFVDFSGETNIICSFFPPLKNSQLNVISK